MKEFDIRKSLGEVLHESVDETTLEANYDPFDLVSWLALVGRDGKGLTIEEDPNWVFHGLGAILKVAHMLEALIWQFIPDEEVTGTLDQIDSPGLREQVTVELKATFRYRQILEEARKAIEDLSKEDPQLKEALEKASFDLEEVFTSIDGYVELHPRSFLVMLILGEVPEGHPWMPILQKELARLDEASKDLDIDALLTEFAEQWHPTKEDLVAYTQDELPRWKRMAVQDHLEQCGTCRTRFESIN